MTAKVPQGWHSLTPRIMTDDAPWLVEFLQRVFGATGEFREGMPAEMRIGDSVLMVSGTGARARHTACLYVYVDDADATFAAAVGLGSIPLEEPRAVPYGDRRAMFEDSWGNTWQVATRS